MATLNEFTASESFTNYSPNDRFSVFGGSNDLWGASSIPLAALRDPSFKIKFDADLGKRLRADNVKVEIFYRVPNSGVQGAAILTEYAINTAYLNGDVVWAIADDGVPHMYTATGSGNSGSVAPTFPSWAGESVVDGDITWVESGQYQPASLPPYYNSSLMSGAIGYGPTGERTFVIVGAKGTVKTSVDGKTWTERDSGVAETLRGVAAGPDGFIAVGDNGVILTSPTGVTWTREISQTIDSLFSVDYDRRNNVFTAVGKDGIIRRRTASGWHRIRN